ncbi:MAG: hypothetical protein CMK89_07305 [Pseudomonadales bacterium]|nr:hypothetical protein [Pseudomonadales bacterium]
MNWIKATAVFKRLPLPLLDFGYRVQHIGFILDFEARYRYFNFEEFFQTQTKNVIAASVRGWRKKGDRQHSGQPILIHYRYLDPLGSMKFIPVSIMHWPSSGGY